MQSTLPLLLLLVLQGQWEYSFRPAGPVYVKVSPGGKQVAIAGQLGRVSLFEWKDFEFRQQFSPRPKCLKHDGDQTAEDNPAVAEAREALGKL